MQKKFPIIQITQALFIIILIISCRPSNFKSEYERAYTLISNSDPNWIETNNILKKLLPYCLKNDNFLMFYSITEMKLANTSVAIKYLKKAITINPNENLYYYFLADIYYQSNKLEDAIKSLKICLKLNPENYEAFILLIKIEYKIHSYKIKTFFMGNKSLIKLESQRFRQIPQALYLLAAKKYYHNKLQLAFLELKRAEKLNPQKSTSLLNLAIICDIRDNYILAKKFYLQYLKETLEDKRHKTTQTQVYKRLKEIKNFKRNEF